MSREAPSPYPLAFDKASSMTPVPQTPQQPQEWHALEPARIRELLRVEDGGLSDAEAAARIERYGPNQLPEQPLPSIGKIAFRQFASPLVYILLAAAIVSLSLGDVQDAGFIAVVLMLNALIGGYQEWKAEQSSRALQQLLQIRASVERDGEVREISAEQVVPGDVVWLESGNRIPADVRVLTTLGLEVDESLLTGESASVVKDPSWPGPASAPVGDRVNMAYAGSIVTRGRGKGLVVATGAATNVGQLALDVVGSPGGKPPLLERMERFSNVVAIGTLIIAVVIGSLGVLIGRLPLAEMFLFVVALAVAAIPEGLPVAITVALAIATTRMARRGVIVRNLAAVEGLGSCTLIATDKTGTLTVNELTIREIRLASGNTSTQAARSAETQDAELGGGQVFQVTGEGFIPSGDVLLGDEPIKAGGHPQLEALVRAGVLCNEADLHSRDGEWEWHGDAVDIALLVLGRKLGWQRESAASRYPQVDEIPFEADRQYAATFNEVDGEVRVFVKGAPERVLAMCRGANESTDADREATANEIADEMAAHGYRVLALAEGQSDGAADRAQPPADPTRLTFLGFVGMIDPLRAGVREAVRDCNLAGVQVAMVTGDHRGTALAIARDLGLAEDPSQVVTASELTDKTPEELAEIVGRLRVFARVAPRQKLEIVQAAQGAGHFVAVTGDGVNDAPALRAANIGVAMGKSGTDVAREASELVISDDNFATIVAGVEEGRIAYENIRKVIYLLLSTGGAELVMVLLAVVAGLSLPLIPVQLLWLNLVTDGMQGVSLAFEPGEGDTLRRKPRPPQESIFNRLMIERMLLAVPVIGGVGFGAFYWMLANGSSEAEARNFLLLVMVLFENFHVANCRSETKSAFSLSPFRSPMVLLGAIGAFGIHVAAMYIPFLQDLLQTGPVSLKSWGLAVALAFTVIPVMEFHKWTWALHHARPPSSLPTP